MADCTLCGRPLPKPTSTRGRPRQYHNECREYLKLQSRLESYAGKLRFADTPSGRAAMSFQRSQLWGIANSAFNRGKLVPYRGSMRQARKRAAKKKGGR